MDRKVDVNYGLNFKKFLIPWNATFFRHHCEAKFVRFVKSEYIDSIARSNDFTITK